jgi:hypothetical protein
LLKRKEKCDVQFALEYIDEAGNYGTLTQAIWNENMTVQGITLMRKLTFSFLAGKTVQFVLALRDNMIRAMIGSMGYNRLSGVIQISHLRY